MRDFTVLGNKVTDLTTAELLAEVEAVIARGSSEVILNTNVHGINLAQHMPWLKEFRNSVRITHADGAASPWGPVCLATGWGRGSASTTSSGTSRGSAARTAGRWSFSGRRVRW